MAKRVLVVAGGEHVGAQGMTTACPPGFTLVRLNSGELAVLLDAHLVELTPELAEALDGLTPEQVMEACEESKGSFLGPR